mmetsp:Transcript_14622/g.45973  ORF Transcript_14622/g.45973 Transcript_14622/m.45973 type:complete len:293 (+) Transcript_14622:261-1139(+)
MTSASSANPLQTASSWPRTSFPSSGSSAGSAACRGCPSAASKSPPPPVSSRAAWRSEARLCARATASRIAGEPPPAAPGSSPAAGSPRGPGSGARPLASSRQATRWPMSSSQPPSPAWPDDPTCLSSSATRQRASLEFRLCHSSAASSRLSSDVKLEANTSPRRRSSAISAAKQRAPAAAEPASSRSSWTSSLGAARSCPGREPRGSSRPSAAAARASARSGTSARRQELCTLSFPMSSCTRRSSRRTSSSARSPRSVRRASSARPRRPVSLAFSRSLRLPASLVMWSTVAA